MPLYEPVVASRYVVPLLDFAKAQHPSERLGFLRDYDLSEAAIRAQGNVLLLSQFDLLLNAVADQLERSDVGFELGSRITIDIHQTALQLAMRRCQTLNQLMNTTARYWRQMTTAFSMKYERNDHHSNWHIRAAAPMSQFALYALEEVFAISIAMDITALLGKPQGVDFYFSMPKPAHHARYLEFAPLHFHFGSHALPGLRCTVSSDLLDIPLTQPNFQPASDEKIEASQFEDFAKPTKLTAEWVTLMLKEAEGIQPSLEDLAELLQVCPRTLTRYLTAERFNLRAVSNQIRYDRACKLLKDPSQSISQIAYRLGYSKRTAFNKAFRLASGVSPSAFRCQS